MGRINNLDEDPMVEVMRRLQALERAAPVGFTEISRGALIVTSVAGLIVRGSASVTGILTGIGQFLWSGIMSLTGTVNISGPLGVTGTATIAGPTVVNGTMTITGPDTKITGPFHVQGVTDITGSSTTVTGPFHVSGDQDNTGKLAIKGDTTVEADLNVINSGVINVGDGLTLEPSPAGGGAINFNPTGSIAAGLGKITMVAPDLSVLVSIGGDALDVAGGTLRASLTQDTDSGHLANVYFNTSTRTFHYKA